MVSVADQAALIVDEDAGPNKLDYLLGAFAMGKRIRLPVYLAAVAHQYADLGYASQTVARVCQQLGSETPVMAALYLGQ
jgi:hypothetical protein